MSAARTIAKLPCQVCGRSLTVQRNGLTKPHKPPGVSGKYESNCRGAGYRQARWEVGQRLRHHAGDLWIVTLAGPGGEHGDYWIRCISGRENGRSLLAHGEYMHRDGWTAVETEAVAGVHKEHPHGASIDDLGSGDGSA